jgi:hypothetical protein
VAAILSCFVTQEGCMADADMLRRLALALPGASEGPHFDRTAFRARVIFAVLAPDGASAALKFTPEEQAFRCTIAPEAFAPTGDAWGRQGWTRATLAALAEAELASALEAAWKTAQARPARKPRKRA